MEKLALSVFGYLLGFGISLFLWGKVEGGVGILPNLRFEIAGKQASLHHWMLFLILLLGLLFIRNKVGLSDKTYYFLLGLAFGGINQGLTFKDWATILR